MTTDPRPGPAAGQASGLDIAQMIVQTETQEHALCRQHRAVNARIALMSVQLIAAHARAALPEAAFVGLRCSDDGTWMLPDGCYTATGEHIGYTADGAQAGSDQLAALLKRLEETIEVYCTSLDDTNLYVWEPFASDHDPADPSYLLDNGDRRLDVAAALAVRTGEPRITPAQFAAHMRAMGIADAALADHGGMVMWPTGHLADGTGVIVSDHENVRPPGSDEPFPGRFNVARYESVAENEKRWPAGEGGLDFNEPTEIEVAATAAEALHVISRWISGEPPGPAPAPCSCPVGAVSVRADPVEVTGHTAECSHGRPRQYVWLEDGLLATGNLAAYGEAFTTAHSGIGPDGGIGWELRTWDGGSYQLQVEPLDERPGHDGCCRVRLSVPGEAVTARVWAG
jgi:hypothetical protein